ncbi:hypothetical protein AB0O76_16485 [Streptomyces sp. NPDC086554]|uniref:hypothetical protein n=1 Tax=Streptomyces sp. NPDC086554 TaxID=3154864 RepID=UPI00342571CA
MPWLTNMAQVMPAFAADVDADRDSGAEPVLSQGLDVVLAAARNMARASRDAGVRAGCFERAVADLEARAAEGITAYTGPDSVRRLRTRES